jgi:hypothetical protein
MNHKKKSEIDRLLSILGEDDADYIPENFKEAAMLDRDNREEPGNRKLGTRLSNDCGKVCFSSEQACSKAISFRLNRGSSVSRLRAYRCSTCNAWHMSSSVHKRTS